MKRIDWGDIPHFECYEFQDPLFGPETGELIDRTTLDLVVSLRMATGWPIRTHWETGGCVDVEGSHGHSRISRHLVKNGCEAVDFHFMEKDLSGFLSISPRLQYAEVEKMRFGGLGIYYDQWWGGRLIPISFHVDTRLFSRIQRWVRRNGNYIYLLGRDN